MFPIALLGRAVFSVDRSLVLRSACSLPEYAQLLFFGEATRNRSEERAFPPVCIFPDPALQDSDIGCELRTGYTEKDIRIPPILGKDRCRNAHWNEEVCAGLSSPARTFRVAFFTIDGSRYRECGLQALKSLCTQA